MLELLVFLVVSIEIKGFSVWSASSYLILPNKHLGFSFSMDYMLANNDVKYSLCPIQFVPKFLVFLYTSYAFSLFS